MKRHNMRRTSALVAIASAAVVAIAVGVLNAATTSQPSGSSASPATQMTGLSRAATAVANAALPPVVSQLSGDGAPAAGAVHKLIERNGFATYAWTDGNRVCSQTSRGSGGCFTSFDEGFNWSISDPDQWGAGQPVIVSGFVPDSVKQVSVDINGKAYPAALENNAVYFELPDASLTTENITGFDITFSDGSMHHIDHSVALPPSLKTS